MSWWKDALFSWWLIICQFFGFHSTLETSKIDRIEVQQTQPLSSVNSPNLYPNLLSLSPGDRSTYTCKGDSDFKAKIQSLRPPENGTACNTPDTRQTWCKISGGKIGNICFNYEMPVSTGDKIGLPDIDGVNRTQRVSTVFPFNLIAAFDIACMDVYAYASLPLKITIEITYGDISPDGYRKEKAMLINGTYPGPTIVAYWGQTIELTVINKLGIDPEVGGVRNGTAIHPHGLRLWKNAKNDGVPGVTQCPIPPGSNYTYTWEIHQYGTTWYHSHLSLQYPNGIVGAILLTDWYHDNPFAIYNEQLKRPQVANSTLINGKGKFNCSSVADPERCVESSYWETTFESGKWHLLRFVNTATSETFRVSIDNHDMTIITADFTSIRPSKPVKFIDIAIGQRYEVLVYGSYTEGNFWLRSEPLQCSKSGGRIRDENVARGIIRYNKAVGGDPISKTHLHIADLPYNCQDVEIENIVPVFSRDNQYIEFRKFYNASKNLQVSLVELKNESHVAKLELGNQMPLRNGSNLGPLLNSEERLWQIYGMPMKVDWSKPALDILDKKSKPENFPKSYAVIEAKSGGGAGMNNIHGHDFIILAQGYGNFDEENIPHKLYNPVRRDVATMPANGYLIISFPVDNDGIWLLHCHLAWHASQGLGLMILERTGGGSRGAGLDQEPSRTLKLPGKNCQRWRDYAFGSPSPSPMDDSGV
ncbi:uncharacterized protein DFL_002058 [Arthrobotrys flagrans]|uniref:Multicopper oxidase n=1 Tax=Arthrobotrys flagrans TaxID=97331 RepID=A0A437A9R5_ARTFL|nr:hypothetical protein DFL_002058 [Arthrobotrys flagrans]